MADCHIILLALSLRLRTSSHSNRQKNAVVDNPTLIWGPRQEEPPRMCACTLYFQKLESLAYILSLIIWGLSLFKFLQTHLLCNRVRFGRSRSFRVILVGAARNPERCVVLVLVPIESAYTTSYQSVVVTMVLSCTVSEIRQLIAKIAYFSYPSLIRRPRSLFPL